jgi:hypothetical protein
MRLALIGLLILAPALALAQTGRADLCAELGSFIDKQSKDQAQKPVDNAPPKEASTAVQQPAPKDGAHPGGTDQPQQSSGISGPVTHGGPGAAGPQGQAQEQSRSGDPNPKAQAASPPPHEVAQPKPPEAQQDLAQLGRSAAEGKDPLACRDVTQKMRRAGLDMPADLLALGALDPKILKPQQ